MANPLVEIIKKMEKRIAELDNKVANPNLKLAVVNWIPTAERLPDKRGEYLVTINNANYREVYFCFYTLSGKSTNRYGIPEDRPYFYDDYGDGEFCEVKNILAWAELPMPYSEVIFDEI